MTQYVAYYRVSTKKQGRSGIGLEAQKQIVADFTSERGPVVGEFVEVQTGSRNMRDELAKALALARRAKATLVIAKLDRLTRNYFFCRDLMESRVDFVCCDQPHVDPFTIHILAAVAEQERKLISERTKYSNQIRKSRGALLGSHHPNTPSITAAARDKGRLVSVERNRTAARTAYADLLPMMMELRHHRCLPYRQISTELNQLGQVTRFGKTWNATQVKRVLDRQSQLLNVTGAMRLVTI